MLSLGILLTKYSQRAFVCAKLKWPSFRHAQAEANCASTGYASSKVHGKDLQHKNKVLRRAEEKKNLVAKKPLLLRILLIYV